MLNPCYLHALYYFNEKKCDLFVYSYCKIQEVLLKVLLKKKSYKYGNKEFIDLISNQKIRCYI